LQNVQRQNAQVSEQTQAPPKERKITTTTHMPTKEITTSQIKKTKTSTKLGKHPLKKIPSSENTSIRRWVLPAARDIERHIHKAPKSVETDSGKRDYEVHFANKTVRQMRLEINHMCKPSNSFKKRREKQRRH
jgi:hypothetical protein